MTAASSGRLNRYISLTDMLHRLPLQHNATASRWSLSMFGHGARPRIFEELRPDAGTATEDSSA